MAGGSEVQNSHRHPPRLLFVLMSIPQLVAGTHGHVDSRAGGVQCAQQLGCHRLHWRQSILSQDARTGFKKSYSTNFHIAHHASVPNVHRLPTIQYSWTSIHNIIVPPSTLEVPIEIMTSCINLADLELLLVLFELKIPGERSREAEMSNVNLKTYSTPHDAVFEGPRLRPSGAD